MTGDESTAVWAEALSDAFSYLERVQIEPDTGSPVRLLTEAERAHWYDVRLVIHTAEMVRCMITNQSATRAMAAVDRVAAESGDPALLAHALAARSQVLIGGEQEIEDGEAALARAVALLDTGRGSPLMRPGAYIMCCGSYNRRRLWTLSEEMAAAAQLEAEQADLPAALVDVASRYRMVAILNQSGSALSRACEAFEAGHRHIIADIIAGAPELPSDLYQRIPPEWRLRHHAVRELLLALAGQPPAGGEGADVRTGPTSAESGGDLFGVVANLELARAVRLADDGRIEEAAIVAEAAVEEASDSWIVAAPVSLGRYLAAQFPPPTEAARVYARNLAERSWVGREHNTRAAQQRRWAEGLRLDRDRLSQLVNTDPMTGLANRRGYDHYRSDLEGRGEAVPVGLLVVDVDRFKAVNDTFGHVVGDEVLVRIAELLERSTRPDDLVARFGGDEFVVLIPGASDRVVAERAETLRRRVDEMPWHELRPGLVVSISVGMARGTSNQVEGLVESADVRMYRAKAGARLAV